MSKSIKYLNLIILLLAASTALAETTLCTPISTLPYSVTKEGVYCLTKHLSTNMTMGNAITILTHNVTIDLNGRKLGGQAAGKGTKANGIYAWKRKNITIRNGTIRGFYVGILLADENPFTRSQGHLIEDIRADYNTKAGIMVYGKNNITRGNQVLDTGGSTVTISAYGIVVSGSGGRLLHNDISGITASGGDANAYALALIKAHGAVVEGNRIDVITGNGTGLGRGVYYSTSDDTLTVGNRITSTDTGVYYNPGGSGSTGKYMDNLTSNVTTPFTGGTAVGTND